MAVLTAEIEKLKEQEKKRLKTIDDRKKYVIGDFVLRIMNKNGTSAVNLTYESKPFDDWLTSKSDRLLFGLEVKH